MTKQLVSLEEVKLYLRIDGNEEDELITSLIVLAQGYASDVLKYELTEELLMSPVKQALLILCEHFYEERSGAEIPSVVYTLLRPYRKVGW